MKRSGVTSRLVKLQRPPPEIRIFAPALSPRSISRTRLPRRPAVIAHIRPAAPAPRTTTSKASISTMMLSIGLLECRVHQRTQFAADGVGSRRHELSHEDHDQVLARIDPEVSRRRAAPGIVTDAARQHR